MMLITKINIGYFPASRSTRSLRIVAPVVLTTLLAASTAHAANGGNGGNGGGSGGTPSQPNGGNGSTYESGGGGGAPGGLGGLGNGVGVSGNGGAGALDPTPVTSFNNPFAITGGTGGYGLGAEYGAGGGGAGGGGIIVTGAGSINTSNAAISGGRGGGGGGSIATGGNGGDGGIGVEFLSSAVGASYTKASGNVMGGRGGDGGTFSTVGGAGGNAVQFDASGIFYNNGGAVIGGNSGTGQVGGTDRMAGVGVSMLYGGMLLNAGSITGGSAGADGNGDGLGVGANAVVGNHLMINNNFGMIAGGAGNAGGASGNGINGSDLTISNTGGSIRSGSLTGSAIVLTGGINDVGTGGLITGGLNVTGASSFQPALNGSVTGITLAVSGPVAFTSGTSYNIRITPTANDSVTAAGAATLTGAMVNVAAGNGTYAANTRTILTATGGLGGTTFTTVTTDLAFLKPTLSYDADDVFLNISAGTTGANYTTAASTQNQYAVAQGLTTASNVNGGAGPILSALNQLTVPQAQAAFDALSGEGITAAQNSAHRQVEEFTSSIFDQTTFYSSANTPNSITLTAPQPGAGFFALAPSGVGATPRAPIHELADLPSTRSAPPPPVLAPVRTWRAWATGFGGVENISGQAGIGSATQHDTIYGGTLGVDYQLAPNYLAGIAIGGSDGEFQVNGRATSGSTTGGHIAFYDIATFGSFYGASSNSASFFTNKTTRNIAGFGGLAGETDRGNFDSHEFRTRLEFGRHFGATDLARFGLGGIVTPFIALELAELRSNGFAERNLAGPTVLGLNVQGQDSASVPSFVGLRYQGVAALGNGMVLSPSLQVAYVHEFAPERTRIGGLINLPGSTFLVDGARPSSNAVQAKAGAEMAIGPRSVIFATFDGEFSGQAQFYGGKGGFRYVW